jgi:transcriptional regulator with XRE-family HTH domain
MTEEQVARLKARIEYLGMSIPEALKKADLNHGFISDIERAIKAGRQKTIGVDGLTRLCKVLGMSVAELLDGQARPPLRVPIIGETTYGDSWIQYKHGKKLPEIIDLWSINDDLVAVRVLENTQNPRFNRGDIVMGNRIFSKHADNIIGTTCIIKTVDGDTYVKVITRGSHRNTYTLRSLDPSVPDIKDVELEWYAPIVSIMPHSG